MHPGHIFSKDFDRCVTLHFRSMQTFREQCPEKSRIPTPHDFAIKKDIDGLDAMDAYESVGNDLAAIAAIDREISSKRKVDLSYRSKLPSTTGYAYSEWDKQQEKDRSMRKAQAC